jgi:flavodoxin
VGGFFLMKILIVYYSRTSNTRKVAEEIQNNLDCDIEEIIDTQNRSGILKYITSGFQASRRKLTILENIKNDPASYDLLVIGTPVWAGNISTPIRTYIHQNQAKFNNVAFFCTAGGSRFDGTFSEMTELSGTSPIARIGLTAKEVKDESYKTKITEFIKKIQI